MTKADDVPAPVRSNENLRAEYLLVQNQYEAFDQRALSLKALATPLLGAGIAVGLKEESCAILSAATLVAISLWLLEAIWKSFQYCLSDRIRLLEAWHRGEGEDQIAPFQIFTSWGEAWDRQYRYPRSWLPILLQPFVFLPYAPIAIVGLIGCAAFAN